MSNLTFRIIIFVALCWLVLPMMYGQTIKETRKNNIIFNKKDVRPQHILNYVNSIYSLPPEFAADILIRIAQSGKITQKRWRKEILEDALHFAGKTQNSFKKKVVPIAKTSAATRSNVLSEAFNLDLDALSLKSRVIREMLETDKNRAREILLFETAPKLHIKPLSCEDSLVYDPSLFYNTLQQTANEVFTKEEIENAVRLSFIKPFIEEINSPAQIEPVLSVILSFKNNSFEFGNLANSFGLSLKKISGDDRSFTYSMERERILTKILQTSDELKKQNLSNKELISNLREYLIKNLTSDRCQDNVGFNLPTNLKDVNFILSENPLSKDEARYSSVLPGPRVAEFWRTKNSRALRDKFANLKWMQSGDDDNFEEMPDEVKKTLEWQQNAAAFLTYLETWNDADENDKMSVFHQKCILYTDLINLIPQSELKKTTIKSYVSFLAEREFQETSRIEWFLHVKSLLRIIKEKDFAISTIISNSTEPILRSYIQLEKL